jgi:hypothetical protein
MLAFAVAVWFLSSDTVQVAVIEPDGAPVESKLAVVPLPLRVPPEAE